MSVVVGESLRVRRATPAPTIGPAGVGEARRRVVDLVVSVVVALLVIGAASPAGASSGAPPAEASLALPAVGPGIALALVVGELVRTDLAEHRLPNRLVVPVIVVSTGWWAVMSLAGVEARVPVTAALVHAGALLVLSLLGGMGMGDVKLAIAIGLASPVDLVAVAAPLAAFLLGGFAGVAALARGRSAGRGRRERLAFGPWMLLGWALALTLAGAISI